jgi:branched-chain amino acid transport system ATP-binding protein
VIHLSHVDVHIGGSHLVQDVSFTVPATGVTALLGRNGAGKTTTLRAILGLVPRTGSIAFDGVETTRLPTHAIVRRYDVVHEIFPELAKRARQRAGTLSGGQQQMLAIGRCLLGGNRILLVDEPTKGLAPRIVSEVAQVLERVAATVPILLVEQNLPLVARLAGPAVVIEQGRVVHSGPTDELLADTARTRSLLGVGH